MLKAILETLDGLSEEIAKHYVKQDDGTYKLDVGSVSGFELSNVTGLKNTVSTLRGENRNLKESVAKFEGLDPKVAREAIEKVEEFSKHDPNAEVEEQVKARIAEQAKQFGKEKVTLTGERDEAIGQLRNVLVKNACIEALTSAGGNVKLLLPVMEKSVRMRKDGSQFIAEVVNDKGDPRIGDSSGNPMTIPQFVQELKGTDDYSPAFKGTGSAGGGQDGNKTPNRQVPTGGQVSQSDTQGISDNLEKIASGEVAVQMGE